MAYFVDRYRDQLAQLVGAKERNRAGKEAFTEFRNACQRACEQRGIGNSSVIEPEDAHDLLRGIHQDVVDQLGTLVAGYSSARWLFMLRRLPQSVFGGQLLSTIAYDSALAEVLSARTGLVEEIRNGDSSLFFNVDGSCVRRLLRFCEGVRTLSQIHVLTRWCGKGARLRIGRDWLPTAEHTDELREAVQIYDRRCVQERSAWSAAGTVFFDDDRSAAECILVADRTFLQPFHLSADHTIEGIAVPRLISIAEIRQLTEAAMRVAHTPWPRESALALWMARAAWFYFVHRHRALPFINQVFNTGYVLMSDETAEQWIAAVAADCNQFVRDAIDHSLEIASLGDLRTLANQDHGEAWPLWPREFIRTLPGMLCVDLCAASIAIRDSLEYTEETGDIANVRGEHFEVAVQKMIDGTKWRPEGETRDFIGFKLKRKGSKDLITDIDAVAAAARTKWESVLTDLRSSPADFNQDFSRYSSIIGVVCTSSVFYAPLPVMTVASPDDVPIKGLNELRAWLDS